MPGRSSVLIAWAVALLCVSLTTASLSSQATPPRAPEAVAAQSSPASVQPPNGWTYVGSQACAACHKAVYDRWSKTRMANVVTDPKVHPEVVQGDFSKKDPAVTFTLGDVAFV